jgi:heat shock protein HslJ
MIDVTTASTVALRAHLPGLILVLLLGVALLSSLMAGFGMAKRGRRSVLHAMLYASTISLTIYTVLDLDSPRVGLIRLDAAEQILTDLHQSFAQGPTPLRGTEWLLTRLGDKPVTVAESSTPPSIILQGDATRFSGSGGCNRIMGTFELDGESITFGPAASTEMHCDRGMETEAAFLSIFTKVKTWSVVGGSLDLRDGANQSVAHFESRKPK